MNRLTHLANRLRDPRYYQIMVLGALLCFGTLSLDFGIRWQNALAIILTALGTQFLFTWRLELPRFDPLSPLITSLSLTLLLRTDTVMLAACAAGIAIGSKFVIRVRNKHVFNPANVAIVSMMMLSEHAWVSSGQWGSTAISALALSSLGLLVLTRARRAETTITFLVVFAGLLFTRALWLGDPLTIPLHQLQNGALLIFAFFMISDPKTTPDTRLGRILFAGLVAALAYTIQFVYYVPNGAILALIMAAPLVLLTDVVFRGRQYQWSQPGLASARPRSGERRPREIITGVYR
jgi:Na+-transporting NADH:ubiquinone oxidoreductase subunit NqrB